MSEKMTDPYEIARFIKDAKKTTPVKVYIKGELENIELNNYKYFGDSKSGVLFGEYELVNDVLSNNEKYISDYHIEHDRRNSAIPILDTKHIHARIEPGAVIRDRVEIGKNAVIMMGAVINIGAEIGEGTMIDMNAVLGARATVGKNAHIGAGAVIAGVLEPPSKTPVIIEDEVLVGANAVVLEGVKIGKGAVVAAGSVVTEDVPSGVVVAGMPARIIKEKDEKTADKVKILSDLRE
ncbi:2,3,4,5-tetrahydropyridine-2,6-dicarboxylate N-acetyltransferase [Clostridiaceae bacterium M8S5]|nr:2,3,4,5-tetrahydropyridine-2,6-dicarboxylate N-acetyltransferase [Clostridiaceae bacterium M8S5]